MGIQFILGLRAKWNHRNTSGDFDHLGSVRENIGKRWRFPDGQREKRRSFGVLAPNGLSFFSHQLLRTSFLNAKGLG